MSTLENKISIKPISLIELIKFAFGLKRKFKKATKEELVERFDVKPGGSKAEIIERVALKQLGDFEIVEIDDNSLKNALLFLKRAKLQNKIFWRLLMGGKKPNLDIKNVEMEEITSETIKKQIVNNVTINGNVTINDNRKTNKGKKYATEQTIRLAEWDNWKGQKITSGDMVKFIYTPKGGEPQMLVGKFRFVIIEKVIRTPYASIYVGEKRFSTNPNKMELASIHEQPAAPEQNEEVAPVDLEDLKIDMSSDDEIVE